MKLPRRAFLHLAAGAAALSTVSRIARAQAYPTRPVTMVVTFPAGSGSDILARILGPSLSEFLVQQVIIENVGGAGGITAAYRVARAPPDGYQFVLGGTDTFAQSQTLYKTPPYNANTDFAAVALFVEQPFLLVTRNDLPASNLPEFIAYAKANQSKMQFGSAGPASGSYLTCTYLNSAIGVTVTPVPYRGAPQGLQDLMAGRIDYYCPVTAAAIGHIENKTMKAIAILSRDRSPMLPTLASARRCRRGSATKTSSTRCATPSWPRTGSRTSGDRRFVATGVASAYPRSERFRSSPRTCGCFQGILSLR
jgi:tripartite-type tricarboxylate transporter receptor subunit TctC